MIASRTNEMCVHKKRDCSVGNFEQLMQEKCGFSPELERFSTAFSMTPLVPRPSAGSRSDQPHAAHTSSSQEAIFSARQRQTPGQLLQCPPQRGARDRRHRRHPHTSGPNVGPPVPPPRPDGCVAVLVHNSGQRVLDLPRGSAIAHAQPMMDCACVGNDKNQTKLSPAFRRARAW